MTKHFPEISAPNRTKDPRELLMDRLPDSIPFPHAPRGTGGGVACATVAVLLMSIFNIFIFCFVNLVFNLRGPLFSDLYLFYFSMSFVLGIFGIVCFIFLSREIHFAVNMAIIYSGVMLIHNYYYLHIRRGLFFAKYIVAISVVLLFYFIFSKRVRNTYRWIDGDKGEDSTS